jgi:P-type Ca2+ transporter type 2C
MGGLDGLVIGLRTDIQAGLSADEDHLNGKVTFGDVLHELETCRKQRVQDGIDNKSIENEGQTSSPENLKGEKEDLRRKDSSGSAKRRLSLHTSNASMLSIKSQAPSGGFSDRKRIFAENRLPVRKLKGIFQLMWMALNDKILVLTWSPR